MNSYSKIRYISWEFIVFLFFVLVFGRGSSLVANFDPRINPVGSLLYFGCIVYMLKHKREVNTTANQQFRNLFWFVFFVWFFLHLFIIDGGFPLVIYVQFLLHFLAGILIIKTYGNEIGIYFEKALVFLSAISVVCWIIEVVAGQNLLLKFPIVLDNILGNSEHSIIFYTLGGATSLYGNLCRNSGCAWEPGLFSVMVCMAIQFNISRNLGVKLNKHLIILLIALATTFSTTGYSIAFIIFVFYFLYTKRLTLLRKIIYISFLSFVFICVYNLPFMSEKIESRSNVANFSIESGALEWKEKENKVFTVDRIEGLYLDYLNFINNPFFGYGLQREKSYVYNNISPNIITSNGILKPFAQFGFILAILLLVLTFKSSKKLSREYSFDVSWVLFMVIFIGSVSYLFDSTPIMRAIELYALYNVKNIEEIYV